MKKAVFLGLTLVLITGSSFASSQPGTASQVANLNDSPAKRFISKIPTQYWSKVTLAYAGSNIYGSKVNLIGVNSDGESCKAEMSIQVTENEIEHVRVDLLDSKPGLETNVLYFSSDSKSDLLPEKRDGRTVLASRVNYSTYKNRTGDVIETIEMGSFSGKILSSLAVAVKGAGWFQKKKISECYSMEVQ